jgi:hypothetical protein
MNPWNDLLIGIDNFDRLPAEQLEAISRAAETNNMTLCHGISAIGNVLAVAALNEEAGLNLDVVADLGWLLESLGKLSASITDRDNGARQYRNRHDATKIEV